MTTTPKDRLIARIKALLSKTVDNGCTESEAMAALAKAQEIMQAHGLDQAAIDAEKFVRERFDGKRERQMYWGGELGYAVGLFTGTFPTVPAAERRYEARPNALQFFGRETDAIFAYWLIDALDGFVTRHARAYIMQAGGAKTRGAQPVRMPGQADMFGGETPVRYNPETETVRRARMMDFGRGVCLRLAQRMMDLADDATKARFEEAKRLYLSENRVNKAKQTSWRPSDQGAFAAGMATGDLATFNKPVNGGAEVRAIAC